MFEIFPIDGGVNAPKGFYADGISAGLKNPHKDGTPNLDVAFIYSSEPICPVAVFTTNRFVAAPIVHYKRFVEGKKSNFVLITTKNANAMTGERGVSDINEILDALKKRFSTIQNPIMSSTGVIGQYLPKDKIIDSFKDFCINGDDKQAHSRAADAIRTTDAFSKEIALRVELDSGEVFHIGAMAKGAGMIEPAMATMLCFITTDANIESNDADRILKECIKESFNAISVDGDMSTNDSVFLLANKKSGAYDENAFREALKIVTNKLAMDIVRDGEGSSRLVAFEVSGALDEAQAQKAAKALANSLLVKTAIFGGDPNWGRVAATIGACGVETKEELLRIAFNDVEVLKNGEIYFDSHNEQRAAEVMKQESFRIHCDLGMGHGRFVAYGCDLGHRYVEINADYRS